MAGVCAARAYEREFFFKFVRGAISRRIAAIIYRRGE